MEREFVLDPVCQGGPAVGLGKAMTVSPTLKGALELPIHELSSRLKVLVKGHPSHLKRSRSDLEMANIPLGNSKVRLFHLDRLPGGRQSAESPGIAMVVIELLCCRGDVRLLLKYGHKPVLPVRGEMHTLTRFVFETHDRPGDGDLVIGVLGQQGPGLERRGPTC
jgi:hypothetical protein